MGEIQGNQAEVGGRSAPAVEGDNVLMAAGTGLQLQVIGVAVGAGVVMVGMVAVEAFPSRGWYAHRLTPRTFDHVAVFAQSVAIEGEHLIPIVSSAVVGHLHPQPEGAESHVDFGRLVAVVASVQHGPGIGRETNLGGRRLVLIDGDAPKRSGNLYAVASTITGLVYPHLAAGYAGNEDRKQSEYEDAIFHVFRLYICTPATSSMFQKTIKARDAPLAATLGCLVHLTVKAPPCEVFLVQIAQIALVLPHPAGRRHLL